MVHKSTILTVQQWGNSLAVRIPADIARSAHFHRGTQVKLAVQDGSIIVNATGHKKISLDERLANFDLKKHGGEIMPVKPIGQEKF